MKPLRLAVAGLGQAARNIHLPALAMLPGAVELVAGCDPDPGSRSAAGVPKAYEGFEEMLAAEKPDVVAICSPPAAHCEQTVAAFAAGYHVFCEKPMAESLEQADRMISAADKAKRLLLINSEFPDMRIHRAAKRAIGSPELGRLLMLTATQSFYPTEHTEAGWRASAQRRVCFDFGVHLFELARSFFDDLPTRLYCSMPRPLGDGKERSNLVTLEFSDGRAASFVINRLSKGPERYLDLSLTCENAVVDCSIGGDARLELGLRTRPARPFAALHWSMGGTAVWRRGNRERVLAREASNPFAAATAARLGELLAAIHEGRAAERDGAHHRQTLAMVLAAYDSAESGLAVELAPYYDLG